MFPLFIAHIVFWVVLLLGVREQGLRPTAVFLLLWIAGYAGTRWLPGSGFVFASYVALLDVVLVLKVLKGDVSIT